ncbi:hypothetical protein DXG03_009140 [Asterophora parasitica]|uniref:Uncharacterized protein n=1 Tax=Asterophora parasitica TaxID=117018 RepID=A0A9P7K6N7_9AGAR|nr:hypothetical protein DXG03_009140 [Asterophora parasitica]
MPPCPAPPTTPHATHPNANTNPAKVVIDSQTKRHTPAQIKADKLKAEQDAAAAATESASAQIEKLHSMAMIKDKICKEDLDNAKSAAHPDHWPVKTGRAAIQKKVPVKKPTKTMKKTAKISHEPSPAPQLSMSEDQGLNHASDAEGAFFRDKAFEKSCTLDAVVSAEGPKFEEDLEYVDAPPHADDDNVKENPSEGEDGNLPDSTLDTEVDGMAMDFDGEPNNNNDYVGSSKEEQENMQLLPAAKAKKTKMEVDHSLHEDINQVCDHPASQLVTPHAGVTVSSGECKVNSDLVVDARASKPEIKRLRVGPVEGLQSDWKKQIIPSTICRLATPIKKSDDDNLNAPGKFDEDEKPEQLPAAKNSKVLVKVSIKPLARCTKDKLTNSDFPGSTF